MFKVVIYPSKVFYKLKERGLNVSFKEADGMFLFYIDKYLFLSVGISGSVIHIYDKDEKKNFLRCLNKKLNISELEFKNKENDIEYNLIRDYENSNPSIKYPYMILHLPCYISSYKEGQKYIREFLDLIGTIGECFKFAKDISKLNELISEKENRKNIRIEREKEYYKLVLVQEYKENRETEKEDKEYKNINKITLLEFNPVDDKNIDKFISLNKENRLYILNRIRSYFINPLITLNKAKMSDISHKIKTEEFTNELDEKETKLIFKPNYVIKENNENKENINIELEIEKYIDEYCIYGYDTYKPYTKTLKIVSDNSLKKEILNIPTMYVIYLLKLINSRIIVPIILKSGRLDWTIRNIHISKDELKRMNNLIEFINKLILINNYVLTPEEKDMVNKITKILIELYNEFVIILNLLNNLIDLSYSLKFGFTNDINKL